MKSNLAALPSTPSHPPQEVSYALDPATGAYVIEGYNWAPPLSNFLPGIAGPWGIPLWAYYVNRGQALCSLGVRDKDGQILEFHSFNNACSRVLREGFRTFLRVDRGPVHEPFLRTDRPGVFQTMRILPGELVLQERNLELELEIEVAFVPLPNLPVAAMAREVVIRNLSRKPRRLEWIDGAAKLLPFGLDQSRIKLIARHVEGLFGVADRRGTPLFRLKQTAADSEQVGGIQGGNFYAPLDGAPVVVDPEAVFGEAFELDRAWRFETGGARAVLASPQLRENKTACALVVRDERLAPGGELRHTALIGTVRRDEEVDTLLAVARRKGFLATRREENARLIAEIGDHSFTASSSDAFDGYARQNFVDNVIRGGMPRVFDTAAGKSAFYLYSRQNGDLERDYHFFVLEPTYLSQGTGHYRSVLQNRRADTWFFPEVEDANLVTFLNLVQLDGYNPLEVRGLSYRAIDERALRAWLKRYVPDPDARGALGGWMRETFTPGELVMRLEEVRGAQLPDRDLALREALALSRENELGGIHEGFWVDHWHYNFDLLELYLMVYPDRVRKLLVEGRSYTWFDDPDVILPRSQRCVDVGGKIRSYGAVVRDAEKQKRIQARTEDQHTVRTRHGEGEIYRTHLLSKLLTIVVNRVATLDPAGTGVEMEAGKPGWNDSMNGLPGLFGSGLSETIELRRAVRMLEALLEKIGELPEGVSLHVELVGFLREMEGLVRRRLRSKSAAAAFRYWDESNTLKERYREQTKFGVLGDEAAVSLEELKGFLALARRLLDGIFEDETRRHVQDEEGVPFTYFVNEVTRWRALGTKSRQGFPLVEPLAFRQRPVRRFLEGPVHWMKDRPEEAADVYRAVRSSPMFDTKLRMYKACESMVGETPELGRAVGAYPRGWIENESIYLHMEYKYLLEILRSGLATEFWRDARTALVPFMDPQAYGRSTLEGASFVVSSAYADARLHGRAFQPRLSGLTCEFIHMWLIAVSGTNPFRVGAAGELELALEPRLPGWLFTEHESRRRFHDPKKGWREVLVPKDAFAFKLLGQVLVVYRNASRGNTFGPKGVRPTRIQVHYSDGRKVELAGGVLTAPHAEAVRAGEVRQLTVTLEPSGRSRIGPRRNSR